MSSRFVSGGAIDAASGNAVALPTASSGRESEQIGTATEGATATGQKQAPGAATKATTTTLAPVSQDGAAGDSSVAAARKAEWVAVERELAEERRKRDEARRAAAEGTDKSLYAMLQESKAAKQAAFEEAHRLKNQFRALDEDDVDFLQGVNAAARAEEARIQAETAAGLAAFRAAQQGKTGGMGGGDGGEFGGQDDAGTGEIDADEAEAADGTAWQFSAGRKRKRRREARPGAVKGLKRRTSSSGGAAEKAEKEISLETSGATLAASVAPDISGGASVQAMVAPSKPKAKPGLVDYGSNSDDDSD